MKGTTYTSQEEEILIERLNKKITSSGRIKWNKITPIKGRNRKSMSNHWQVMKRLYVFDGKRYVLKQPNLFDEATPQPKADNAKKTPQNKRERISTKRVIVKKSFLWGAFILERYE